MSVTGTSPLRSKAAWLSSPGTCTTIVCPGLNPSIRLHSVGVIGKPSRLRGMAKSGRSTRRPVWVEGSGLVHQSFGKGRRHWDGSKSSQVGPMIDGG
jgi:hypothetical protein